MSIRELASPIPRPPGIASSGGAAPVAAPPKVPTFSTLLSTLGQESDRGEALVRHAASGTAGGMEPSQLLALQAGIYRYGEVVDIATKLVDRASTGVKTVVQGQ
jgi:hypothetical protein